MPLVQRAGLKRALFGDVKVNRPFAKSALKGTHHCPQTNGTFKANDVALDRCSFSNHLLKPALSLFRAAWPVRDFTLQAMPSLSPPHTPRALSFISLFASAKQLPSFLPRSVQKLIHSYSGKDRHDFLSLEFHSPFSVASYSDRLTPPRVHTFRYCVVYKGH